METLKGKTVVITGGNDGIGKQIAMQLAKEGVNLALVARDTAKLDRTKTEIASTNVHVYSCDICNAEQRKATVEAIMKECGQIDALINNAGIIHKRKPLVEFDDQEIDAIISTNLTGLMQFTKLCLPHLLAQPEGGIINISSVAGTAAREGQTVYAASKWGVRGFTDVLKVKLQKSNVHVAGIYQGGTRTDLFRKAGDNRDTSSFTEPEDLAAIIVFMLKQPKKCWMHEVHVSQ